MLDTDRKVGVDILCQFQLFRALAHYATTIFQKQWDRAASLRWPRGDVIIIFFPPFRECKLIVWSLGRKRRRWPPFSPGMEVRVSNAKGNLIRSCGEKEGGREKKWWLSLITNLPLVAPPHYPAPSFLIKISITHNTGAMKRSSGDDGSGMPMASLLVIAHCNWKLLLSGFVCSGNYNKLSAWHVVCTDVGH